MRETESNVLISRHILRQELAGAKGKKFADKITSRKQTKLNESYMKVLILIKFNLNDCKF